MSTCQMMPDPLTVISVILTSAGLLYNESSRVSATKSAVYDKKADVYDEKARKAADKAEGSRANPAADGSRATSLQSCGCNAIVQVRTHMSLHMYLTVCDQSLQSHFFGLS